MKALVQRVQYASVTVGGEVISKIEHGLLVFLGVVKTDTTFEADFLSRKICNLRIFNDEAGKMNLSLLNIKGQMLVVSQFTLCGDTSGGNRPGFEDADLPGEAQKLYEYFSYKVGSQGIEVKNGEFGADMKIELLNDGPVTFMLER